MDQYETERYGLPAIDRAWYWTTIKMGAAITPKRYAVNLFSIEAQRLVALVDRTEINISSDRVRVARMVGMEPYSCDWSMLMVLDHLNLLVSDMTRLIGGLTGPAKLHGRFSDQQYEPDPDVGVDVIEGFAASAEDFVTKATAFKGLRGNRRFHHSWLGPMNAHQWLCWTAARTRVHRRHAVQIRNVSGVV